MALNCGTLAGRGIECADVVGGLKAVYFANVFFDLTTTATATESSGVLEDLPDDNGSDSGTYQVYKYDLRPELSSMTINIQADTNNGTVFYEQTLSLMFHKLTPTDGGKIVELAKGRLNVYVLDNNDQVYVLGAENGLDISGGNLTTGTSFGDMNGFQLDFSGRELYPVWFLPTPVDPTAATFPFDGSGVMAGTATIDID